MPQAAKHLLHEHSIEDIRTRLAQGPRASYLRDFVYGGVDGAVTTFAVVAGVVGAELSARTILILGFANLVADGFSMAAANFLATKSEREERVQIEAFERQQIVCEPAGEREEVRQILIQKGFAGAALDHALKLFTSDPEKWVRFMVAEEYGLAAPGVSPVRSALSTFSAFAICGLIPLLPYLGGVREAFFHASALTLAVFFGIGSIKSRWSLKPWWRSGLETAGIGATAAVFAYGIGSLLK